MSQILWLDSSPRGADSASRQLSAALVEELKKIHAGARIVRRDLSAQPLPHVTGEVVAASFTPPEQRTAAQKNLLVASEQAVDEVLGSSVLVLGVPMWNFSVPSVFKAWIDHVVRAGRTFAFTPQGPQGLATGKKVYVALASGGVYSQGPYAPYDFVVPYLKGVLGFMGMTDVQAIRAEGLNDARVAPDALKNALAHVPQFLRS